MGTSHAMTTLIVNVMPQFTVKPPKKIERYEGQSVTQNCSADGQSVPNITWSRCNGELPRGRTQVKDGQLKIRNLKVEDSALLGVGCFKWRRKYNLLLKLVRSVLHCLVAFGFSLELSDS